MFNNAIEVVKEQRVQLEKKLSLEHLLTVTISSKTELFDVITGMGWVPENKEVNILMPYGGTLEEAMGNAEAYLGNFELGPFANTAGREDEVASANEAYRKLIPRALQHINDYYHGKAFNTALFCLDDVSLLIQYKERTYKFTA